MAYNDFIFQKDVVKELTAIRKNLEVIAKSQKEQKRSVSQLSAYTSLQQDEKTDDSNRSLILAVDFDGTLCENKWPAIGNPIIPVINYVKKKKADGWKLILWTNRVGFQLTEAISWCKQHGIEFDAVNANLPEVIDAFGADCRKIFANEYLDDRSKPLEEIMLWGLLGTIYE